MESSSSSSSSPQNCSVKVAVHVRPLIGDECNQSCKECVSISSEVPQVQIGTHSFTFDAVYGNGASSPSLMFEECVAPLVQSFFQGYNATVLAYGQTGSGKTYTMGTATENGCGTGLIPQVMDTLFTKIDTAKHRLHVSFIEILGEEVRDLLNTVTVNKSVNAHTGKVVHERNHIQIRETPNGVITVTGASEVAVSTLQEMYACLKQGSSSRATGSTKMNNKSSRSHAIFTVTLERTRKIHSASGSDDHRGQGMGDEYFCAKLHLVDLAGSERAKRTGSGGLRLKEGIHINKGLLALGNVISALGDEKKQKDGAHVPYRDSKLTRILQDSLGGNSKTVMIACISPADINAEESLITLKYANRARNIQNKPVVIRDVVASEIQRLQQQLQYLRAELSARGAVSYEEGEVLRKRITWLEATNRDLSRELHEYRSRCARRVEDDIDAQDGHVCNLRADGLKRGFQSMDTSDCHMGEAEVISGEEQGEIDEVTKEWEHALRQTTMDRELNELNKYLEQKESEIKLYGVIDTEALKQHFEKKMMELEREKRLVRQERDFQLAESAANSDERAHKAHDIHAQKLKVLEAQILALRKKQENQVELLKQKQRSEEAIKRLQGEIQRIKTQKVQLQHKIKLDAEQFRQWKASREKELLQLKKEGRRNEYAKYKLEAINQRQRMVVQRKTDEAAMATKRLKELLESRKSSLPDNPSKPRGKVSARQINEKSIHRWLDQELEVIVNAHEIRSEFQKQYQLQAALSEEIKSLKQVNQLQSNGPNPQRTNEQPRLLSRNDIMARITTLENMLSMSSDALTRMASQLSEAEERERAGIGLGRWNQICSLEDAKNLFQYIFNTAAQARCQISDRDKDIKDVKEQLNRLATIVLESESQRKELMKELQMREEPVAGALASTASASSCMSLKHFGDETSYGPLSSMSLPAPKLLKLTPEAVNVSVTESTFIDQTRKVISDLGLQLHCDRPGRLPESTCLLGAHMVPVGKFPNKEVRVRQSGKLWNWKRSHNQWMLQFKWKWQKPWKLSEWIKHSDETIIGSRPQPQSMVDIF